MVEPLKKEFLEAGVHFGHQTHRWNPKMRRFIFAEKNGIYLLDLEKTAESLVKAQGFLRQVASQGGTVLFVGTKRQGQSIIAEEATRCGQYFVNFRWLGGLLTNFQTIRKSVARLKTIRAWKADGTLDRLKKKEAAQHEKEMARLEKSFEGIIEMERLPKALFVVDAKREETAVREANRLEIPVVALVDTNCDPDPISYIIPGNDDAIRSIKLMTSLLADAILEGHQAHLAGIKLAKDAAEAQAQAAAQEAAANEAQALAEGTVSPDEAEAIVSEAAIKAQDKEGIPKKKRVGRAKPPEPPKPSGEAPSGD